MNENTRKKRETKAEIFKREWENGYTEALKNVIDAYTDTEGTIAMLRAACREAGEEDLLNRAIKESYEVWNDPEMKVEYMMIKQRERLEAKHEEDVALKLEKWKAGLDYEPSAEEVCKAEYRFTEEVEEAIEAELREYRETLN